MIRSPGLAASMACWMEPTPVGDIGVVPATYFGALPPTVTVTASTDCLPLPAVMSSSPQYVWPAGPARWLYCCSCWIAHNGMPLAPPTDGTVTVICVSLQFVTLAATPPMVTLPVPRVAPKP